MTLRTFLNKLPFKAYVTGLESLVPVCQCRFLASSAVVQGWTNNKTPSNAFSTSVAFNDEGSGQTAIEKVGSQLQSQSPGRLFAVILFEGFQRKVTTEDVVVFPGHAEANIGQRIKLNKVLLVGGKDFTIAGRPVLSNEVAKVEATVIEKTLTHTVISHWYKRRNRNSRTTKLRRDQLTYLRIDKIEVNPYGIAE